MTVFFAVLLPEVVSKKSDFSTENKQNHYCICQRPCFEPMIACDKPGSEIEWYHYVCMSITRAPKGSWICPKCKGNSINKIRSIIMKYYVGISEAADVSQYFNIFQVCIYHRKNNISYNIWSFNQPA